jgi:hypothetical protein
VLHHSPGPRVSFAGPLGDLRATFTELLARVLDVIAGGFCGLGDCRHLVFGVCHGMIPPQGLESGNPNRANITNNCVATPLRSAELLFTITNIHFKRLHGKFKPVLK